MIWKQTAELSSYYLTASWTLSLHSPSYLALPFWFVALPREIWKSIFSIQIEYLLQTKESVPSKSRMENPFNFEVTYRSRSYSKATALPKSHPSVNDNSFRNLHLWSSLPSMQAALQRRLLLPSHCFLSTEALEGILAIFVVSWVF